MHFFESKSAEVAIDQIKINRRFYSCIYKLIQKNGREEDALTVFDLEDMIEDIPIIPIDVARAVCELASNAGKEYVSAHEVLRREQELTAKAFKAAYLGFLIANQLITAKELLPAQQ